MHKHVISVDTDKCIGCNLCVKTCVAHNIQMENGKAKIILPDCTMCGHCSAVCPKEAITISGYDEKPIAQKETIRLNPNDVLKVIQFRRTIRHFKQKEIPEYVIQQIMEAGRFTHTARNLQDVSFVVLKKEKEHIEKMAINLFRKIKPYANIFSSMARNNSIDDNFFFFHAPVVIVILAKDKVNGILAAQNMEFVAEANGLGVLFSGFFSIAANMSPKVKKALQIPKGKKVATTLVLGYPDIKYLRSAQREKLNVVYM